MLRQYVEVDTESDLSIVGRRLGYPRYSLGMLVDVVAGAGLSGDAFVARRLSKDVLSDDSDLIPNFATRQQQRPSIRRLWLLPACVSSGFINHNLLTSEMLMGFAEIA